MSGKSRRKRARKKKLAQLSVPKPPSPPMPKKEPKKEKKPSVIGRAFALIVAVMGLLSAYFYFRPSVEIEVPSSNSSNTEGLFSRPFVMKNNSPWASVYDIHVMCVVQQVVRGTRAAPQVEYMNAAPDFVPSISELAAGERHSVPCIDPVITSKPLLSADVILSLDYIRPRPFLGHTATEQGYRAVIGEDGRAYWTPFVQHK
jgi:hypothetical protein